MKSLRSIRPGGAALVLLFSPAILRAQPVITEAFWLEPGEKSMLVACDTSGVDPGPSGATVTWDFTGLTSDPGHYSPYTEFWWQGIDFASAPASSEYDAHTGYLQYDSSYSYVRNHCDFLEWVGFYHADAVLASTFKAKHTDGERWVDLPFSYEDSYSDIFAGTQEVITEFGTFTGTFDGTLDWHADGYGTLMLPTQTYTDVVRMRLDRTYTSTPSIGSPTTTVNENYLWFSPMYEYILLDIENIWTDHPAPTPDTYNKRVFYAENPPMSNGTIDCDPTGIDDPAGAHDLALYPNPSAGWTQVAFSLTDAESAQLLVADGLGRVVYRAGSAVAPGRHVLAFDASAWASGVYRVVVRSSLGESGRPLLVP